MFHHGYDSDIIPWMIMDIYNIIYILYMYMYKYVYVYVYVYV